MRELILIIFLLQVLTHAGLSRAAASPRPGEAGVRLIKPSDIYWVMLAGGSGARLWPLSRESHPKQFLSITPGKSLIAESIDRLKLIPNFTKNRLVISTSERFRKHVDRLSAQGYRIDLVVDEPGRRDTAPAILLSLLKIRRENPDAIISFIPADHFIPASQHKKFSEYLTQSIEIAENTGKIILLGKEVDSPATGFGYIEAKFSGPEPVGQILRFHEKPKLALAESFVSRSDMYWNMGIFSGKASAFIELYKDFSPKLYQSVLAYVKGVSSYELAQKISVDFAIMEPSAKKNRLLVLPVASGIDWQDIGNSKTFIDLKSDLSKIVEKEAIEKQATTPVYSIKNEDQQNAHVPNHLLEHHAKKNRVLTSQKEKLVAFVGVEDLCVIDTNDVLLISKCGANSQVKQLVEKMGKDAKETKKFLY